ncbi:MAG: hydrolase TatD [Flavobacteriales bacterium]|nr:hydrolase TatD [Flavobacteriales bacterium]|tara:strand:- start:388 stop:1158 length:771 start_codon:yes stop_codon:yes gene_type:complete
MHLIDTHTHLFAQQFDEDRSEVVHKALEKGVQQMLLPNIDSSSIQPMLNLCTEFPNNCFPMMGLHPCDVKDNYLEELVIIEEWLQKEKFVAVGEIGIDLYWDKSTLSIQQDAFRKQVRLAKKYKLPIAIHVRDSFDEVFTIIDEMNDDDLSGVFHCFTGNETEANHIINYGGFKLGIGGVVTFKNSGLDKTLRTIPIEHLILETDSPYLAPEPYRGKRNESSYVVLVAEKLAEIYGKSVEEIADITTQNTNELFKI